VEPEEGQLGLVEGQVVVVVDQCEDDLELVLVA
jgi:hypothetical protein